MGEDLSRVSGLGTIKSLGMGEGNLYTAESELNFTDERLFSNYTNFTLFDLEADVVIHNRIVQALFTIVYVIIFVLGFLGNSLVCYVVGRNKAMQTVTNLFITNLALADILLLSLAVPFTPLYTFLQEWVFGEVLCHLVLYAQGTSVYISTLTLTSIAIDRFRLIISPFKPRMKLKTCFQIIGSIWFVSLLATLPYGIYIKYQLVPPQPNEPRSNKYGCFETWPSEEARQVFSFFTAICQFVVPFFIISFCYIRVSLKLKSRAKTKPGTKNSKKEELEKERKRRTNRMLISMVVFFGISWLPLNVANLLNDIHSDAENWTYYNFCFFVAHTIAMTSTCYNPFLYAWLNENFRKEFKQVLGDPCYSKSQVSIHKSRRFLSERTCNGNETVQESFLPASSHVQGGPGSINPTSKPLVGVLETIEEQTSNSQSQPAVITMAFGGADQITARFCSSTNEVEIHVPRETNSPIEVTNLSN